MPRESPLRAALEAWTSAARQHAQRAAVGESAALAEVGPAEPDLVPWGDPDSADAQPCMIAASYGDVRAEYAALRRASGLFDGPHRSVLAITGSLDDRRSFFNRMLTQEMKDLGPGVVKEAFWLNRKGRIEADLLMAELGDRMFIDLDAHQASSSVRTLSEFLFAEDVEIQDVSATWHRASLHGPAAWAALAAAADQPPASLEPNTCAALIIDGVEVIAARRDLVGSIGIELFIPASQARLVAARLLGPSAAPGEHPPVPGQNRAPARPALRPVGWHAFNIARIEAGSPLFNIDFGVTNLPHETGVLRRRVSFTKGCYLGQEIVARMESLGKPKQMLVGLRLQGEALPIAGGQVFQQQTGQTMGELVGTITSSTVSPMLGATAICFAMVKTAHAVEGRTLLVSAEGELAAAVVAPLQFWPRPADPADTAAPAPATPTGQA